MFFFFFDRCLILRKLMYLDPIHPRFVHYFIPQFYLFLKAIKIMYIIFLRACYLLQNRIGRKKSIVLVL